MKKNKKALVTVGAILMAAILLSISIPGCAPKPAPTPAPVPKVKSVELLSNVPPTIDANICSQLVKTITEISDVRVVMRGIPSVSARFDKIRAGDQVAMTGFMLHVYPAVFAKEIYAEPEWGPQKMRMVWPTKFVSPLSMMATEKSGITKVADLKGKKVIWHEGAPGRQAITQGFLAFAGLTWDDVTKIPAPGYNQAIQMVMEGKADATYGALGSAKFLEMTASPAGCYVFEFPHADKEGWARLLEIHPGICPGSPWLGPGDPDRYPMETAGNMVVGVCGPELDEDVAYVVSKAALMYPERMIIGNEKIFKADQIGMKVCKDLAYAEKYWLVPFHPGLIRFLGELGIWNDKWEAWQTKRLQEEAARLAAFK